MTKTVLVIVGVFVALVFVAELLGLNHPGKESGIKLHAGVELGDDEEAPWLCQPSDMKSHVSWPHPLYRRPTVSRPAHTQLYQEGWDAWYIDPPSEEGQG